MTDNFTDNTPATEIDPMELLSFFDTKEDLTSLADPFAALPAGTYGAQFRSVSLKKNSTEKGDSVTATMSWLITSVIKLDKPIDDQEAIDALVGRQVSGSVNSKMVGVAKDIWIAMAKSWMGGTVQEIQEHHVNPAAVLKFLMSPSADTERTATIKVIQRLFKPKDGTDPRVFNDVKSVDCDIINGARVSDVI